MEVERIIVKLVMVLVLELARMPPVRVERPEAVNVLRLVADETVRFESESPVPWP